MIRVHWVRHAAVLLLMMVPQLLHAEARIDYFESLPITADTPQPEFNAYGHRFSLELKSNDRLIERLPQHQKKTSETFRLYRGSIRDIPGSWVRLGGKGTRVEGAMWDGQDLYAITTYERIAPYLKEASSTPPQQPVIFRLSDTDSLLPTGFCGLERSAGAGHPDLSSYKYMVRELKATAFATSLSQLEVSIVGDTALQQTFVDPIEAMLLVANVVDGIFGEQVGVLIAPTDLRLVPQASDPFTTTNPEVLLGQVSTRAYPLTHPPHSWAIPPSSPSM
jgi:hypothetical protein